MIFMVTCRIWNNKRGGYSYPVHEIEVAEASEAPSEALHIASLKGWGTVYAVRPQKTLVPAMPEMTAVPA